MSFIGKGGGGSGGTGQDGAQGERGLRGFGTYFTNNNLLETANNIVHDALISQGIQVNDHLVALPTGRIFLVTAINHNTNNISLNYTGFDINGANGIDGQDGAAGLDGDRFHRVTNALLAVEAENQTEGTFTLNTFSTNPVSKVGDVVYETASKGFFRITAVTGNARTFRWLTNLKGSQGDAGVDGSNGIDGVDGADGNRGLDFLTTTNFVTGATATINKADILEYDVNNDFIGLQDKLLTSNGRVYRITGVNGLVCDLTYDDTSLRGVTGTAGADGSSIINPPKLIVRSNLAKDFSEFSGVVPIRKGISFNQNPIVIDAAKFEMVNIPLISNHPTVADRVTENLSVMKILEGGYLDLNLIVNVYENTDGQNTNARVAAVLKLWEADFQGNILSGFNEIAKVDDYMRNIHNADESYQFENGSLHMGIKIPVTANKVYYFTIEDVSLNNNNLRPDYTDGGKVELACFWFN